MMMDIYDYSLFLSHQLARAAQVTVWLLLAHRWLNAR